MLTILALASFFLGAGEAPLTMETPTEVPVVMYHLVTEKPKYLGKYGITPAELESDLQYLQQNGYTTVLPQQMLEYVRDGAPLPQKPVLLSFDDGNTADFSLVLPLLEQYDARAVVAIIGEATDRCTRADSRHPQPSMHWDMVRTLHQSGRVEIANHSYNLHGRGGIAKHSGEDMGTYHARIHSDFSQLQDLCEMHIGYRPITFVYPLGELGTDTTKTLENAGFIITLSCQEGKNILRPGDTNQLWRLHRTNRPHAKSISEVLKSMEKY
jgi:peptidoglycan/xylan/chitin deacetylase (PgdA/CDA1 family)